MNENGLNYIDLFAGAGGLSEGFIQSGYRPVAHVEMNEHAAKTIETRIASEKLLPVVFEKQKVHTLLQVITYWVNDNEYMIDFVLWQG